MKKQPINRVKKVRPWSRSSTSHDKEIRIETCPRDADYFNYPGINIDNDDINHAAAERLAKQVASLPVYLHAIEAVLGANPAKFQSPTHFQAYLREQLDGAVGSNGKKIKPSLT